MKEAYDEKNVIINYDVFSRKAMIMIYKLNDKKSDAIIQYISEFCANNTFPEEFCSDNGPEFKNSKLNDICKKEGITFIHIFPIILIHKVLWKDFIIQLKNILENNI